MSTWHTSLVRCGAFVPGVFPGVKSLAGEGLASVDPAKQFSKVAVPSCTLTPCMELQLPRVLVNTW